MKVYAHCFSNEIIFMNIMFPLLYKHWLRFVRKEYNQLRFVTKLYVIELFIMIIYGSVEINPLEFSNRNLVINVCN